MTFTFGLGLGLCLGLGRGLVFWFSVLVSILILVRIDSEQASCHIGYMLMVKVLPPDQYAIIVARH